MARDTVEFASRDEIDSTKWLSAEDALKRLTREADKVPLQALIEAHASGRLDTHVVVIARHGKAKPRASWHDEEATRPLTPIGYAHSAALVPVLSAYGVSRAVSSRWERCAATVEPYVGAANLRPWFSDNLTEVSHERSPARVAATVRQLLETPVSTVLCTHRPVLPTVFDVVGQHAKRSIADLLPSKDPFLEPGEALIAHVTMTAKGPRIIAVEHVAPELY
jgi:8-oxo-dGTP diphosphatase